ncbi:tRNA lysidine(34) synthetase TilS [Roseinatronobacter alkalisoli]|uniref:tRNA(Ile)-lysidine synthase n=1 Tax=Roseinatronobacter alkalisoli TaxID=3028235 RepID=A0ABT5T6K9_9RHOB|nr:tRNA lysidine(34) synthetase TilS [Roseinatronobacter sp. HJB301]MDD7970340.1 tRNA lysidine(34) synthetase TilS [Roseinatronobacter sp. HJB301]
MPLTRADTGRNRLQNAFAAEMARAYQNAPLRRLGLAVSGGGDSMALMRLAQDWATAQGCELFVATVDHGLRDGSAAEAAMVARSATALGLPHQTLAWRGWDRRGNLQDMARQARKHLLAEWAQANALDGVALGHTRDDQAETLLMRLTRGSGVEGLTGIAAQDQSHGTRWLRPLLAMARAELRDYLRALQQDWAEDPSNLDTGFDRIKARQALQHLAVLGLDAARLAATAERMQAARESLDFLADTQAQTILTQDHGDFIFDAEALAALPRDTRTRLVARALQTISGNPYRPRLDALNAALACKTRATLHGCILTRSKGKLRITREYSAVATLRAPLGAPWDGRWRVLPVTAPPDDMQNLHIAALGPEGADQCRPRSAWRLPYASLLASPAIWRDTTLVAAPLAMTACGWQAKPCHDGLNAHI